MLMVVSERDGGVGTPLWSSLAEEGGLCSPTGVSGLVLFQIQYLLLTLPLFLFPGPFEVGGQGGDVVGE